MAAHPRNFIHSNIMQELAGLLPTLKTEQRPSKHVIVDASVSYHKVQQAKQDQATSAIRALMAERDDLLRELNALRSLCEPTTAVPRQARPIEPAVLEMLTGPEPAGVGSPSPLRRNSIAKRLGDTSAAAAGSSMPLVSSSLPSQNQVSHPPGPSAYAHSRHPSLPCNLPEWNLSSHDRNMQPSTGPFHPDGSALLWVQSPNASTTPPKDMDLGYGATPLHLVDDSAFFWAQHPHVLDNTPPWDPDSHIDLTSEISGNAPLLWPPDMPIDPATTSRNEENIVTTQHFQSANPFIPTSENLSI